MSDVYRARAEQALKELLRVEQARYEWRVKAGEVADRNQSLHGVSGNVMFQLEATKLFEEHAAHIVKAQREKLNGALAELFKDWSGT